MSTEDSDELVTRQDWKFLVGKGETTTAQIELLSQMFALGIHDRFIFVANNINDVFEHLKWGTI